MYDKVSGMIQVTRRGSEELGVMCSLYGKSKREEQMEEHEM